jgi:hypothetical protein
MDSKPQPALANVNLAHPHAYIATFMVNRFCLFKNSGFTVAHFGLIDDSGKLLDRFGCIFTDSVLNDLKENLVTYSAKIGTTKNKKPAWMPNVEDAEDRRSEVSLSQYGVVDFIHLTNWQEAHAEICFWNYSKASLADHMAQQVKTPFPAWGLALLRCDLDFQKEFLEALYPA